MSYPYTSQELGIMMRLSDPDVSGQVYQNYMNLILTLGPFDRYFISDFNAHDPKLSGEHIPPY